MKELIQTPTIYTDEPVILDLNETDITPIASDEIFVQLEENPRYYISSYGRLYSELAEKILKPQLYGTSRKKYYTYRIYDEKGYKNCKAHILTAKYFLKNDSNKTQVHHLISDNKDIYYNYYRNLQYVSQAEHYLIERNIKLYLYDIRENKLKQFENYVKLCDFTSSNYKRVHNYINRNDPIMHLNNGKIAVYRIRKEIYNGLPLHVAIEKVKETRTITEKKTIDRATAQKVIIGVAAIATILILGKMYKSKKEGVQNKK